MRRAGARKGRSAAESARITAAMRRAIEAGASPAAIARTYGIGVREVRERLARQGWVVIKSVTVSYAVERVPRQGP